MLDAIVEAKVAVAEGNLARVAPVRQEHIVVYKQGADGIAQKGGKVSGKRRHNQHLWLARDAGFAEPEQRTER